MTERFMQSIAASMCLAALGCAFEPATQEDIEGAQLNAFDPEPGASPAGATNPPGYVAPLGDEGFVTDKACGSRGDFAQSTVVIGSGHWGTWAECFDWCPVDSWPYAANVRSESSQGSADDTAINSISLHCYNRFTGAFTEYITSSQGIFGAWQATGTTHPYYLSNPIKGGGMKIEAPQGSGDDTAANSVKISDFEGGSPTHLISATGWGSWNTLSSFNCPGSTAVCGVKTRMEWAGPNDETRLNGIEFACCHF
jgi:hypothetical protein